MSKPTVPLADGHTLAPPSLASGSPSASAIQTMVGETERPLSNGSFEALGDVRRQASPRGFRLHASGRWIARRFETAHLAVWLLVSLTLVGVWVHGASNGFIPCEQDCGETFDALQYVDNYRLYGFRFGIVQDHATSPRIEARPYFYTHNVNLGGVLFTVLDALGAKPFWLKQLVTLAGFGAGLVYVYRATAYHTRSALAGLCVLTLFITDVEHVLAFGLSPLRAWHWLALFGLVFHAGRLARQPRSHPRTDWIGIFICALIAFACGYDYWIICLAVTLLLVAVCRPRDLIKPRHWPFFIGVVLAFVLPFVLRQIQMIAVLGFDFWMLDVVYSAAIKVSVLSRIVPVPSTDELDATYRAAGVLRAPSAPASSVLMILVMLSTLITYQLIPSIGLGTFVLTLSVGMLAIVAAVRLVRLRPRVLLLAPYSHGIRGHARRRLVGTIVLIAPLVLGVVAGLAFFSPHSLTFYLKHEFPLVAGPVLVIKGVVLAAIMSWVAAWRGLRRYGAAIAALLLIVDHLVVQVDNVRAFEPMDVSWIPAVEARHEATFAVSWLAHSVSAFTDTWAVGITPGLEREVSSRVGSGLPPFVPEDFFLFGERDADTNDGVYTRPDFWLYYRTDRRIPFDKPVPSCRTDYLTALLQRVGVGRASSAVNVSSLVASVTKARPGDVLTLGGRVSDNRGRTFHAELLHDGAPIAPTIFNCQTGVFVGEYQIPATMQPGPLTFGARLMAPDGRIIPVPEVQVDIVMDAPPAKRITWSQPTADELIAMNPTLPVADRGREYVIFDLRGLHRDR
jgi:hypothetical protein